VAALGALAVSIFAASDLDAGDSGTVVTSAATIDTTKAYQTIEGLGGATAFYAGWIKDHPYKQEIYSNAFAGLNLSMLRLGNWFRYTNGPDSAAYDIVSNANRILGHSIPIYISSWAPPAFLKSNGQVGNGGTLLYTNGGFAYTNFAQYWYDSLLAYGSNGISPNWISIQNEPDWAASYDSCVFHPSEDTVKGTNYASYSKALDAVFQRLTNLPSLPKILAPEVVGVGYNDVQHYAATMNSNSFYGVAHHLYGGSTDGTPDGYSAALLALANVFPAKPRFMTEFGYTNMMDTACLIHDCLTLEQAVGFNFWSLVWPISGGLINQENPYNVSSWTNAPPGTPTQSHGYWLAPSYWAMKHYSYFISPGYRRVYAADNDANVRSSAFLSPDNLRLVVVLINTNATASSAMTWSFGTFAVGRSSVYQTVGTNTFQALGSLSDPQMLPPLSLTTLVLDKVISVGAAANPSPTGGVSGVALGSSLSWTPGSNALTHAVYCGINSNAVAQASPGSQEFQGVFSTANLSPSLAAGLTYFWRVDEIAGANTNAGAVWSFSTVAPLAKFVLNANDVNGTTTSFNGVGNWVTNGTAGAASTAPGAGFIYDTGTRLLRSPQSSGGGSFGGASLTLSAAPAGQASLVFKSANGATFFFKNLVVAGGGIANGGDAVTGWDTTQNIAGDITVAAGGFLTVASSATGVRAFGISGNLAGSGNLTNGGGGRGALTYSGNNNAFSGQLVVNDSVYNGTSGAYGPTMIQAGSQMNLGGPGSGLVLDNGIFQPTASFALIDSGGKVTLNAGGGILQVPSNLVLTISNPIVGVGNLLCRGGGTVQLAGSNTATGNLIVSNSVLRLLGGGTLKHAQLGISNNATLDVTALSVPLSISNRIILGGNVIASVNRSGFTSLLCASNVTYGGTLTLSNAGPALAYGDTLKLFSASNYSGSFSGIIPAGPGTGLLWNTNWLAVDGTLFVTSSDPALMASPRFATVSVLNGALVAAGTNGNAPGTPFYILASTNLTLPLSQWTVIATNQFGSSGGFRFTNTIDSSQPQRFFTLQLP
jgi:glucuronoarabinoxylan endo-1,4-beta-xylanase